MVTRRAECEKTWFHWFARFYFLPIFVSVMDRLWNKLPGNCDRSNGKKNRMETSPVERARRGFFCLAWCHRVELGRTGELASQNKPVIGRSRKQRRQKKKICLPTKRVAHTVSAWNKMKWNAIRSSAMFAANHKSARSIEIKWQCRECHYVMPMLRWNRSSKSITVSVTGRKMQSIAFVFDRHGCCFNRFVFPFNCICQAHNCG